MPARQKVKGNTWERKVAEIFSEETGTHWQRNICGSGGFVGGKNAHRIAHLTENQTLMARGDIVPGDGFEKTIIECKFYKDFAFHSLMALNGVSKLNEWIEQVNIDHEVSNSEFYCVVFKINRKGMFIAFPSDLLTPINNFCTYQYAETNTTFAIEEFNNEWVSRNLDALKELNK
jgi:hypothetical protein